MAKTCADLFEGFNCTILGNPSEEVSGIAYRSNRVQPGDAFFCIVGLAVDGHSFAQDAIDRGAKVLIVERKLYLADATDVTEVVVADSRKALAYAAAQFYDNPSRAFSLVGVTGTNGKTTTTYLVEHIARMAGKKTGVIGTVGTTIGDVHEKSEHTTPESSDLQHLFARMRDAKCDCVAMEVSSHALDLCRTWDTRFSVTAFTNLTQDHLDYHHTFEAYFEAKALLFSHDYPARRVICIDDKWGAELNRRCMEAGDMVVTTGFDESAAIHPVKVDYGVARTDVVLSVRGEEIAFSYPLVGRFNVSNIMTAFGVGLMLGIPVADILRNRWRMPAPCQVALSVCARPTTAACRYTSTMHTPPMRLRRRSAPSWRSATAARSSSSAAAATAMRGSDRSWGRRPLLRTTPSSRATTRATRTPTPSSPTLLPVWAIPRTSMKSCPIAAARFAARLSLPTRTRRFSSLARGMRITSL